MQQMLEKTAERLCVAVTSDWPKTAMNSIELSVTTGFDGASGYVNPQQKFYDEENDDRSPYQSLFVCGALKLKSLSNPKYLWNNPTSQSYRFFRPLKIAHQKEDNEMALEEYNRLGEEIKHLKPFKFTMGKGVTVQAVYLSDPILSMVYLDRRREMHKKRPLTNDITRFLKPGQWTDPEDRSNED
ncbi:PREDICTED: uncharacterized protein LOC108371425 [Rhagoletis zephyria]|uniref:uncharacterized protein LOC108371425 n=1 Tax=Rhagoletis zephyria TaxID=28612 RepID=UPI0008116774|nr:PREDICTED: uncharacterized protein LOC108371425 [Rhagoletis zephyria]